MSVFNAETKQQETQTTETQTETQESWINKLVEKRGEKWSDPEVIAKGKIDADEHIANLERQLEEMRADLGKSDYAKTLLETLQGKAGDTGSPKPEEAKPAEQNTTDAASLESLVEEAIRKREAEATTAENLRQVEETLTKVYGDKASDAVRTKAQELGMSLDSLQELAEKSPTAFLRLVGEQTSVSTPKTMTPSVNTQASTFNTSAERDWAYFQKLRRESPQRYYTPKVQQELMDQRTKLGDRFYNK